MALGYLLSPVFQIQNIVGKPVVGAKIYVYEADTTTLVNTYKDFDGNFNTNPIRTDLLGNATIIADDSKLYDIEVKDALGILLMGKKHIAIGSSSGQSGSTSIEPGYGISVTQTDNSFVIEVDTDLIATKEDLNSKQDTLYAGDNISIDEENKINVVNRRELQTQYPIRMDRSNNKVKIYLDGDWTNQLATQSLVAGPDMSIMTNQQTNETTIGVDTNSTASGEYNFYAGYNNSINGNYNAAFGQSNDITGNRNTVFGASNEINGYSNFGCGYDNEVSGSMNFISNNLNYINGVANTVFGISNSAIGNYNFIAGQNNSASANNCGIISQDINTSTDDSYVFGKAASAIAGGTVLGANSTNLLELRNNKTIYYNYDNNLYQLKPYPNIANYDTSISKTYTITSNDEIINLVITDEMSTIETWMNSYYTRMLTPMFIDVQVKFDSQVQNAGHILANIDYGFYTEGNVPNIRCSEYTYITKIWSLYSDLSFKGYMTRHNFVGSHSIVLTLRNMEHSLPKWTTGQNMTATIHFYTTYLN